MPGILLINVVTSGILDKPGHIAFGGRHEPGISIGCVEHHGGSIEHGIGDSLFKVIVPDRDASKNLFAFCTFSDNLGKSYHPFGFAER